MPTIGTRFLRRSKRNAALNAAAAKTAARLAESSDASAKWVGKHALREISSAAVKRRVAR